MKKKVTLIERIELTGPQPERDQAFPVLKGYLITRSGPLPVSPGRYDTSQFQIIAERELPEQP